MNEITTTDIEKFYDNGDPSHDILHIKRVLKTCESFGHELGANMKVLKAAALLHDIVNIPKDSIHRSNASKLASDKAKDLLKDFDYSNDEIESIGKVIVEHSYSANIKASSLESEILQDADKLDAMGAIGVMRWATVGSRLGASYYDGEDIYAESRELDGRKYSLDHFEEKLLKLYERLNTKLGKSEGRVRMEFFKSFLDQLRTEIT